VLRQTPPLYFYLSISHFIFLLPSLDLLFRIVLLFRSPVRALSSLARALSLSLSLSLTEDSRTLCPDPIRIPDAASTPCCVPLRDVLFVL